MWLTLSEYSWVNIIAIRLAFLNYGYVFINPRILWVIYDIAFEWFKVPLRAINKNEAKLVHYIVF
jgi:hypothetical protein